MRNELWKVDIPKGKSGDWEIDKFTIKKDQLAVSFRELAAGRDIPPGDYTRLKRRGSIIMSDTPAEIYDLFPATGFHGKILIGGLGLGVVLNYLLRRDSYPSEFRYGLSKPPVTRIDVVEISPDVIALVWDSYLKLAKQKGIPIHIWNEDILQFRFPTGMEWDFAWYDIWDNICGDNLESMKRLHRRFGRKVKEEQHSWNRYACERDREWICSDL
jgi:hypothetical protein